MLLPAVLDHQIDQLHEVFAELAHPDALDAGVRTLEQHREKVGSENGVLKAGSLLLANCDVSSSSWHGTRVSGMIGAQSNNSVGITGISWNSFILPVRALGKCGGVDSDILAAMRWAGGLTTASGAPIV